MMRCSVRLATRRSGAFAATAPLLGAEQIDKAMPTSTTRKPRSMRRGNSTPITAYFSGPRTPPGEVQWTDAQKHKVSPREAREYATHKKWELTMKGEWDDLEKFRHLPKPKKQFGNEGAEIVWPYAVLLQNAHHVHRFTKGIYVYYPQTALTDFGVRAIAVAKAFAQRCLTPITFHNSQCHCEGEMLLEHGDTPWVVVHCLDGRHRTVVVDNSIFGALAVADAAKTPAPTLVTMPDVADGVAALLQQVQVAAAALGDSVDDVRAVKRLFHERPPQNQYVRVDYQWYGETPEARQAHTVKWMADSTDADISDAMPRMRHRTNELLTWLNEAPGRATQPQMLGSMRHLYGKSQNEVWRELRRAEQACGRVSYSGMMPRSGVATGSLAAGRKSGNSSAFDPKASTAR